MSEESLRLFMERLSSDPAFVERVKANAAEALAAFDLSPTERMALASNDEDALRRLGGSDVQGYFLNLPLTSPAETSPPFCPPTADEQVYSGCMCPHVHAIGQ